MNLKCGIKISLLTALALSLSIGARASDALDVRLIGAETADRESSEVIAALQKLLKGLADGNADEIAACLSEDVTQLDNRSHKYIYGKKEVLDNVKRNVIGTASSHPVKSLTVYNPFVHVKGDTAMVSFRATKEMADQTPDKLESWCYEVYERKNGQWLVLQLRTSWSPIK